MSTLLAIEDGIVNGNLDMADVFFIIGTILAVVAGLAYASGVTGTTSENHAPGTPRAGYRYHLWAPALVAFAVAAVAFGLFLL